MDAVCVLCTHKSSEHLAAAGLCRSCSCDRFEWRRYQPQVTLEDLVKRVERLERIIESGVD